MRSLSARLMRLATLILGGGSLLLFGYYLFFGPPADLPIARSHASRLAFDSLLCLAFFLQHSGMVRRGAKERLAKRFSTAYVPALYSIASGVALIGLVVLWQPADQFLLRLPGPARWLLVSIALLACAGFAWGVRALREFDPFGTRPLDALLRGTSPQPIPFAVGGPYRVVRHPLYLFMLLLIWCTSQPSTDRLLFDILWTAWIVVGTKLEERDLVAELGQTYRQYQTSVPMLVPSPRLLFHRRQSNSAA